MRDLVRQIRDELMGTPDTVCLERARLATEAWRVHEHEPAPIRRAHVLAHVLRNMTLDLRSNPVFAGNTSARPRAWMLLPEYGIGMDPQVLLEHSQLAGLLDGAIPDEIAEFWRDRAFGGQTGIGHLSVDMDCVVHRGLQDLIAECDRLADEGDEEQRVYRAAMRIALQAVIDWAHRYARAARIEALSENDPLRRECLERVGSACEQVPEKPARNLFEALQSMALVHLAIHIEGHGMSVSTGLPDRVLAPFIQHDFDPEQVTNLIAAFMLKITANSLYGRGYLSQTITVGGADHLGIDRSNALTACFLDACDRLRVGDPPVFLRWHPGLDPKIKAMAARMLADGVTMPLLINDIPTVAGFEGAGVAPQDAWEYAVIGCNELGIPGRSADSATATCGNIQYLGLLNETLAWLDNPDAVLGMDQLLQRLEGLMRDRLSAMRRNGLAHKARTAREMPTPLTSSLMRGCIRRGKDMAVGMDYHLPGVYERGLTNAANALAAIEELVFDRRELRLSELTAALGANHAEEGLRARMAAAPKWGNGDDRADRWALALVEMRERVLDAIDAEHGSPAHMVCHVVRSLHHLDGARIGASADGRKAGTPVADSIGAAVGTARSGPTGILRSVLKLDPSRTHRGGYNLNLTLPGGRVSEDEVLALIETFFDEGGQELQISSLDPLRLRQAQQNPGAHGDLVVRIAGFSGRFVDLSKLEQDELIARAEAAAGVPSG
ncbi:MAG: hypothetical protein HPY44_21385 [Armatimonadetes bacterium]|nr:hypothetical protein [Armatimonadota bacterium]